ncbi:MULTISPECIES: DUF3060 domain-containing protein [Roseateles]|uniref:DUF3060 domain-containing protein n=1 Tax=Pelomonas aquatica TaxID=431058 RepID=A0ABU1ZGZ9_9BURK|nr:MULTISPECIES: DUF3060 domain-containing protein [Roseateles]MDR7299326.1 hypothetical protein [Pelomonas aquatica]
MLVDRFPLICTIAIAALPLSVHAQPKGVGAIEVNDKVISISGNGHQRTFPCNGRKLEVMGSDHVVTTTGECSHVDVSGANNTVNTAIQAKGVLEVAGANQKVNWKAAGEIRQEISGSDHRIVRVP